jgi:hypothetical protein
MYRSRIALFLGLGVLLIPISLLVTLLQAVLLHASSVLGIHNEGEGGGVLVLVLVALGTALTLFGVGLVQAATAQALVQIDAGRQIGPLGAYRLAFARARPMLRALAFGTVVISVLATSLFLVPIAVWLVVRWALVAPVVELEELPGLRALHRSSRLVRLGWLKVATLSVVAGALALLIGPLIGTVLIILTNAPLSTINIVSGIVYALAIPLVALTTAYLYFDLRVREQLAGDEPAPAVLPPELELPI